MMQRPQQADRNAKNRTWLHGIPIAIRLNPNAKGCPPAKIAYWFAGHLFAAR